MQDSCYETSNEPPGVSQIDTAVRLCVTVVNFAPESHRAVQMVVSFFVLFFLISTTNFISLILLPFPRFCANNFFTVNL